MSTINFILMVVLIAAVVAAAILIIRYVRKQAALETRFANLEAEERRVQKRENELERMRTIVYDQARRQSEWLDTRKHIYANFEVLDSEEQKPTIKAIGKSLSSKIGYALRKEFPDIQERHDDTKGGRKVYSVDFYVTPFDC